ncbi:MAG: internal scaffolding protein [Arizlama microvirus]|nr:MAG: internal scaffolding protein [Arizlama microvirus]
MTSQTQNQSQKTKNQNQLPQPPVQPGTNLSTPENQQPPSPLLAEHTTKPTKTKNPLQTITKRSNPKYLRVQFHTGSESLVQQSAKDECDVNRIMEKFNKTGLLPQIIKEKPQYGDYSGVADYQTAQNTVIKAQEQFLALPAKVRDRFDNDPAEFLAFATDASNKKEMGSLGLLNDAAMAALKIEDQKAAEAALKAGNPPEKA